MNAQRTEGDDMSGGGTETLRRRLERFGDPRETWKWQSGEVDYVAQLELTPADVPELLAIARQWVEAIAWPEDKEDMSGYAPVHAWRGLAQLKATEAIGPLLEMLDPLDVDQDDWYLEEFPHAFAWIGPASMAPLRDYLADDRHGVYPRASAAQGLKELAERHGELRDDVVKMLCDALTRFDQTDKSLNAFIITGLLELKATDAAELVERAHAADRVDISVNGNWNTVRKELGVEGLGLVPQHLATMRPFGAFLSPEQQTMLESIRLSRGESDAPLDTPVETPTLSAQSSHKPGRNDPCPCGSGKKYKKCCMR
jgi:hypothetical protein